VAEAFAATRQDFTADPVAPAELPAGFTPDKQGRVRVRPGALAEQGGADGFFVARFRQTVT
jgi:16S rRNA (cytosine967-C5)-methyltransferase